MKGLPTAAIALGTAAVLTVGVIALTHSDSRHPASVPMAGTPGCITGWTCVRTTASRLDVSVAAPMGANNDRFVDTHAITDGGVEYSYQLAGSGAQVIVFALPVTAPAAHAAPVGGASRSIVVRGHRATWSRTGSQGVLTWSEGAMHYRAWYPSTVPEPTAIAATTNWITV